MAKSSERKTVLIIEDVADIRYFASRLLVFDGYCVLGAESGEEGLRLVRESQVSLVLLDLRLPGIDGWVVLEQMKAESELSTIPVIVFTASAAVPQQDRALSMGAVDYLGKPVSAATLKEAVARILG